MSENNDSVYFGFGSIGIIHESNGVIGVSDITGSITINLQASIQKTTGGLASYPVSARLGRTEPEVTVVLNERPGWLEEIVNEANKKTVDSPSEISLKNAKGSSMSAVVIAPKAGQTVLEGTYIVTATDTDDITIKRIGPHPVATVPVETLSTNAKDVDALGVTVKKGNGDLNAGDVGVADITFGFNTDEYSIPQVRKGEEYQVKAYSAKGGNPDSVNILDCPRVMFGGANMVLTDNEPSNGVEISGSLLAPKDGSSIYTRKILRVASIVMLVFSTLMISLTEGAVAKTVGTKLNRSPGSESVVITASVPETDRAKIGIKATGAVGAAGHEVMLVFDEDDWGVEKTIDVSATDDVNTDDETASIVYTVTSGPSEWLNLNPVTVAVAVTDDD